MNAWGVTTKSLLTKIKYVQILNNFIKCPCLHQIEPAPVVKVIVIMIVSPFSIDAFKGSR